MGKLTDIVSYRVVIENRPERTGGFVALDLRGGLTQTMNAVATYAELAALGELLRNHNDLQWDDSGRIVQVVDKPTSIS